MPSPSLPYTESPLGIAIPLFHDFNGLWVSAYAFYLRVSTGGQTVENQRRELAAAAEQRGWTVVELYSDNGFSGAKGPDKRPAFDRLCKDAVAGKFDIIAAWSVGRLGRSVVHLAQFVEDMRASGIGLFLLKQGLDSETPTGRAMLGMCSVFAELEERQIGALEEQPLPGTLPAMFARG